VDFNPHANRPFLWLIAAVAVAVGLSFGAVTQDDAFISFRYADHLVAGHGLVFNVGEWVEGYTNLLWTLLLAGVMALGGEPVIGSTIMGLLAMVGTIVATAKLAHGHHLSPAMLLVPPLLVASDALFILESVEGLETSLFAALVTFGTLATIKDEKHTASIYFVLACLTRPEGVAVWGFVQLGLCLWAVRQQHLIQQLRASLFASVPIVGCLLLLTIWRLWAYGDPLPNTFYAKTGHLAIPRGLGYLWAHIQSHPVLWALALGGMFFGPSHKKATVTRTTVVLYLSYVVAIGGDFKPTGRFIITVLPMMAVLTQGSISRIIATPSRIRWAIVFGTVTVGLWAGQHRLIAAKAYAAERHANLEARKLVGDWIAAHTPAQTVIAIHSAGVIPFYANRRTIDMWGLTDRTIARTPIRGIGTGMAGHERSNPTYVFEQNPDLYLPEDRVFTLHARTLDVPEDFPSDFRATYKAVSVPISGRFLNMWVRR